MSDNNTTDRAAALDASLAMIEREEVEAQQTDCGVPNCDRSGHEARVPLEEWRHRVANNWFDGRTVEIELTKHGSGPHYGWMMLEATTADLTADQLRAMADLYESYPGWLRVQADAIDRLNGKH